MDACSKSPDGDAAKLLERRHERDTQKQKPKVLLQRVQAHPTFPHLCKPLPSIEQILAEYDFDWETSEFRYPKTRGWGAWGGRRAGNGWPERNWAGRDYISLRVGKQAYAYHRLVWKMYNRADPVGVIDHINGDRHDNRIENLRDVSAAENSSNNHGRGFWARRRIERIAQEAATRAAIRETKRLEIESREKAELARLLAKYGCKCGEGS